MYEMKRLQFRHNNTVWENRSAALKYFEDIVSTNTDSIIAKERSDAFGDSVYAEPMIAKYLDEDGKQQIIFAIGVDGGKTAYHLIDSKELAELIDSNKTAIEVEVERAKNAEKSLSGSIETEIARAIEAELFLSGAVDTERDERVAADAALQAQITENVAKIVPVTENLGANIREEYVLKNANGEELGSHIKVYKDSALVGAEVNYKGATGVTIDENGKFVFSYSGEADKTNEYLYLVYRNENGGLNLVALDFENFLMENEEGNGIKIVDHKITINIKGDEKYLAVNENGLQTINIDEAIETAVETLSVELHAKVDAEIERSTAADEYISGLTAEFSASTVSEFVRVDSALTIETERALAAELSLSGAVDTERLERINKDREIDSEINGIKDFNNTLNNKVDVEIARSINEDENFRLQIEHLTSDLNTEISNRELSNASIRGEFNAADIALGSRIDTEAEVRMAADNTLSERIDDEAEIRSAEDALLTTTINGVSERLAVVEADYLKYQDKADVLMAVSGAQNVAIEAVNAAASAQTTADEAKSKIEGFMAAAEIGGAAIDTLIEIQNYIKTDGTAAAEMLEAIADNKTAIETEAERAKSAEKTLENDINAETSARIDAVNILSGALVTEVTRATGAESVNATAISNEVKRATDAESTLQTTLTAEINNRESADNSIRDAFAAADESIKTRIAAEELARQTSYDALNKRIDDEATNRANAVASLTAEITNGDKAVRESYEAADAVLQGAIQAETSNREQADANLQVAIQSETSNREAADIALGSRIDTEKTAREGVVIEINGNISALSDRISVEEQVRLSKDNELDVKINTLSGNVETSISNVVNELNNKKVNDVVYDNGNNVIKLIFADGSYSEGFDASEFVVDGMLDDVTFDQNTNEIKFVWNTSAGKTEFIVPLDKFVDQYSVADDSISFLKISDDNKVSAIVDGSNGFANTLATTDFVKDSVNEGVNAVKEEITNYVDAQDEVISNKIDVLNGDANTVGSVSYTVKKKFNDAILTDGAPITSTSIEEANKVHSLVRKIDVNGEYIYFVSSDASDMYYESKNGEVKLADYITSMEAKNVELENRVKELEDRLANLGNDIEGTIKNIIKSYVVGTTNEIKVVEDENKLKIGFDDNAIFGEI